MKCKCAVVFVVLGFIVSLLTFLSPPYAQGYSVGILGHDYTAAPGDVITGSIEINNSKNEVAGINIKPGDFWRTLDEYGNYQWLDEAGKESRSLLPWLKYSPETADLPALGKLTVQYSINVPNDRELNGTYWAALFVSSLPSQEELASETATNPAEKKIGIDIVFRYCALVTVTIVGSESPTAKFTNINIEDAGSGPRVVAEIENSSMTIVRPSVWVVVKDILGTTVSQSIKKEFTVLPESKRNVRIRITDQPLPAGEYLLMVIADYGVPKLVGAQAKLSVSPEQAKNMIELFKAADKNESEDSAVASTPPAGESN